jgi:hypothetical protein
MSVKQDVFGSTNPILQGFTTPANGWKQIWPASRPADNSVIEDSGTVRLDKPIEDSIRNEMMQLVQHIFLAPFANAPKRVMFCGVDTNDSSGVWEIAGRVLAKQTGLKVCLIDANVKDAPLSKRFHLSRKHSSLGPLASLRDQCHNVGTNLFVAGASVLGGNHGGLAASSQIKERVLTLASSFEYLLIDAPPARTSVDTAILGQVAGSAVLVLEAGSTNKVEAKRAKEKLELAHIRILGTVLQNYS